MPELALDNCPSLIHAPVAFCKITIDEINRHAGENIANNIMNEDEDSADGHHCDLSNQATFSAEKKCSRDQWNSSDNRYDKPNDHGIDGRFDQVIVLERHLPGFLQKRPATSKRLHTDSPFLNWADYSKLTGSTSTRQWSGTRPRKNETGSESRKTICQR